MYFAILFTLLLPVIVSRIFIKPRRRKFEKFFLSCISPNTLAVTTLENKSAMLTKNHRHLEVSGLPAKLTGLTVEATSPRILQEVHAKHLRTRDAVSPFIR